MHHCEAGGFDITRDKQRHAQGMAARNKSADMLCAHTPRQQLHQQHNRALTCCFKPHTPLSPAQACVPTEAASEQPPARQHPYAFSFTHSKRDKMLLLCALKVMTTPSVVAAPQLSLQQHTACMRSNIAGASTQAISHQTSSSSPAQQQAQPHQNAHGEVCM